MVAMEEFPPPIGKSILPSPGRRRSVLYHSFLSFFFENDDIRIGRCYHCSRGDAVNRELGHDSPWMRRPLEDVFPGPFPLAGAGGRISVRTGSDVLD